MRGILAVVLLSAALAGCLDATGTGADGAQPVAKHAIHGQVLTPAFNPVAGAFVTLENPSAVLDDGTVTADSQIHEAQTDADGKFTIMSFPGTHRITLEANGHETLSLQVTVPGENLTLFMEPVNRVVPYQDTIPFDGYIECAMEALIITPSCDTLITFAGGPGFFEDDSVFTLDFGADWMTVVLDVNFDPSDHPGIAGMRVSAYDVNASAEVFDYQRIHQEWGAGPFTLRLEPGSNYGDEATTPEGAGAVRYEFFPHGHADDTACNPQDGQCFLGAGATQALSFQAIATIFYHEAAPEGWTLHSG